VAVDHAGAFHALFPPVNGAAAGAFPAAGRLGDAPVDGDFLQEQADDAVVGLQRDLLEAGEDPGLDPLVAAVPDGGRRAGAVGDRLIRAAEPQDLDELFEDDPVGDPPPVAAQRMGRRVDGPVGKRPSSNNGTVSGAPWSFCRSQAWSRSAIHA
jgi:hypothetical protein